ncbi:MAG: phosphoribosylanthranilate isomerase [Firmicutes bacterium]|nr:phosphoribosylanthranilate isomerase [Bacillota bacterium]MCL5038307.1 phosphoribosylanthranilate isomerase [Bacillota bacterium]
MKRVLVKICGIKTLQAAWAAVEAGADMVGFVFAPSRRRIEPSLAREITLRLPKEVWKVGVFVNEEKETVQALADLCHLDVIQLHGQESPEYCQGFKQKVFKAWHIPPPGRQGISAERDCARACNLAERGKGSADGKTTWPETTGDKLRQERELLWLRMGRYQVTAFLLDTLVQGGPGGTGLSLDWNLASELARLYPVILAGGLTPERVAEAVQQVQPLGVDVSSGVETDGEKDPAKMRAFIAAVS